MKNAKLFVIILAVMLFSLALTSCGGQSAAPVDADDGGYQVKALTDEARTCVECHATETHGIVSDWDNSRHADEGVSCI
ncbi:MAG: beta-ketoacyl-ACP synthase, partial [Chloroflexi bacterium]